MKAAQWQRAATSKPPQVSPLVWAQRHATIVHPTRGRIPFAPYPYQAQFLDSWQSKLRLILKARQVGYSLAFALEALYCAREIPETLVLLVSRSQDLATNLLRYCYQTNAALPDTISLNKENESEMGFVNGSRIKSIPANRSTGRGFAASRVYLDEFAYSEYAEEIYQSILPTVAQGGVLTAASTPNGIGNLFHKLWVTGNEFAKQRIDWRQCPAYYTEAERAAGIVPELCAWYLENRPLYTEAAWASEYECDFAASGGGVFRNVRACIGSVRASRNHGGHVIVAGVDFAQVNDYTAVCVLCATCQCQLALERINRVEWRMIREWIARIAETWGVAMLLAERNSAGAPNVEALQESGLPVYGFDTTPTSKRPLIQSLALAFEQNAIEILDNETQQLELESYQMTFSSLTHQPTYHAPNGAHDDTVMALALAWYAATTPRELARVVYSPVQIGRW